MRVCVSVFAFYDYFFYRSVVHHFHHFHFFQRKSISIEFYEFMFKPFTQSIRKQTEKMMVKLTNENQ